jgi:glycosyltransferase involved in cell wall biosynthesis
MTEMYDRPLRIAHLAPVVERVPPITYGGIELVVHLLVEAQVRAGHQVTLFASGDSVTSATLVGVVEQAMRTDPSAKGEARNVRNALACFSRAASFDVIHNHLIPEGLALGQLSEVPVVTTNHRAMNPGIASFYRDHRWWHVSASRASEATFPRHNSAGVIYHGIDVRSYPFRREAGSYLLFLGRMSPDKGPAMAIEVARRTGRPLLMAGKIGEYRSYWESDVRPLVDGRHVVYIGEVGPADKRVLLAHAEALLFPISWKEPFGLVMVEAMACGTPVVALHAGSVPEVIEPGVTGFVANAMNELAEAVEWVSLLDRRQIRKVTEQRFDAGRMAADYERLYRDVLTARGRALRDRRSAGDLSSRPSGASDPVMPLVSAVHHRGHADSNAMGARRQEARDASS